jgi:RNA polymerase sigma-70 factor (ECF subfamily)
MVGAPFVYKAVDGEGRNRMRDADSFDEFYRSTSTRLMRYGYAVVGDLTEAQDVVQEAYTRAWQRWRTVAEHPHPEAWVRLVVTRLATDRWRRLARFRAVLHRSGPPEDVRPPNEDTVVVVAALRRLPVTQRQALALHYLFDMPVAEIAQETGVPVGTVTSWLSRGRAGLAQALSDDGPPGRPPRQAGTATLVRPQIVSPAEAPTLAGPRGASADARPAGTRPAASGVWEGNDDE